MRRDSFKPDVQKDGVGKGPKVVPSYCSTFFDSQSCVRQTVCENMCLGVSVYVCLSLSACMHACLCVYTLVSISLYVCMCLYAHLSVYASGQPHSWYLVWILPVINTSRSESLPQPFWVPNWGLTVLAKASDLLSSYILRAVWRF